MDILVDFDDLRNHLLNFNQLRNLDQFLFNPLHLINLRQSHRLLNNLLNNFLNCDNIVNIFLYSHYLLNNGWHFFDNLLDVRHYLLHLLYLFLNQYFFNIFVDLLDLSHILNNGNYLLHNLRSRNDPLDNFLLGNNLLHYSLNRHWYFKRHYYLLVNLHSLNTLVGKRNHLFDFKLNSPLLYNGNWHLSDNLLGEDLFLVSGNFHRSLHNSVHRLFNFNVDIVYFLHLLHNLFYHRNMHRFFNFNHLLLQNLLFYQLLNKLGNLHNFLNNPGDNNHLLDNLLNFNNLGHFDHFFNDFINLNRYLFDPVYYGWHLHQFFLHIFDCLRHLHEDIHELFNLNHNRFLHNKWHLDAHLFDMNRLHS